MGGKVFARALFAFGVGAAYYNYIWVGMSLFVNEYNQQKPYDAAPITAI